MAFNEGTPISLEAHDSLLKFIIKKQHDVFLSYKRNDNNKKIQID